MFELSHPAKDTNQKMSEPVILASDHQQASASVHLLPFGIAYDGPASVADYFAPTEECASGASHVTAHFRGRRLKGVERKLPDGYTGLLLKPCGPTAAAAADTNQHSWQTAKSFKQLTLWNHDLVPTATDWHSRCIDWLAVADQIQAHVSSKAVEQELTAIQQQQQ